MNKIPSNKPYFARLFLHLHTINHHRYEVMKNCFACGLYKQGLTHDLSKYSLSEFHESVKYFQGNRSPYMLEKELFGYANGWMHHKGRNKHHWEYWYDMVDGKFQPLEMPFNYFVEMICDRVAACKIYQKDQYTKESALNYYQSREESKFIHPNTNKMLKETLKEISIKGEKIVFHELKLKLKQWKEEQKNLKNRSYK
jgi:hypothetical protein